MQDVARLLPERCPEPGELVEVRSRRWLVEAVEQEAGRVSLACADDDAQGQALEVCEGQGTQLALQFNEDEKGQLDADITFGESGSSSSIGISRPSRWDSENSTR